MKGTICESYAGVKFLNQKIAFMHQGQLVCGDYKMFIIVMVISLHSLNLLPSGFLWL